MAQKFSEWLKVRESQFGQPVDEPVPNPEELNNGAFPEYQSPVVPRSGRLAPARRSSPRSRAAFYQPSSSSSLSP